MLLKFVICSILFVAIHAQGEYSVLNAPKAVVFKGNDALPSSYAGDVAQAVLGYPVNIVEPWNGLIVESPFDLAKKAVCILVDGVDHLGVSQNAISTYPIDGGESADSLDNFSNEMKAANVPVCNIDFNNEDAGVNFRACFDDAPVSSIESAKHLKPSVHKTDKHFLQSMAYLNAIADNYADMQGNVLIVKLSTAEIVKTHGENSKAMSEALKLISSAINKINVAAKKNSGSEVFVAAIASKATLSRVRRADEPAPPANYNLAEYYNEEYPVIFNIILWFMVVFGLSLLAICYAIGSMDPGRDSIIYRMTSTRMKKDN